MISGERAADGSSMPGRTIRPVMLKLLPFDATKLVVDEVPLADVAPHALAGPCTLEPAAKQKRTNMPSVLSLAHVPVVSPGMVSVLYSHVLAAVITTLARYQRLAAPLMMATVMVPGVEA